MSRFTWGMRRLAILAGVIGLAVGSAIAYFQFAELVRIRAQHDRFQALMATPALSASLSPGALRYAPATRGGRYAPRKF